MLLNEAIIHNSAIGQLEELIKIQATKEVCTSERRDHHQNGLQRSIMC